MISPMILIYVSVEKLISTKMPSKKSFLRSATNQRIFLIMAILWNMLYYLPVVYFFELQQTNITESNATTTICSFSSIEKQMIVNYLDMTNRVIMPTIILACISAVLIVSCIRFRARILQTFRSVQTKVLQKEIRVTFSLLILNIVYVLLSLPLSVATNFSFSDYYFVLTFYCLYIIYSINFYLMIISNSEFRKEFLQLFKKSN